MIAVNLADCNDSAVDAVDSLSASFSVRPLVDCVTMAERNVKLLNQLVGL